MDELEGVQLVLVGLGDVKAAKAFCQLTRIPEESVYASPTAAPYDALGYQPGFARPSPPALLKPKCGALPPSSYISTRCAGLPTSLLHLWARGQPASPNTSFRDLHSLSL